jgi:hypothetical protein
MRDDAIVKALDDAEIHAALSPRIFDHEFLKFLWAAGLHSLAPAGDCTMGLVLPCIVTLYIRIKQKHMNTSYIATFI